MSYRFGSEVVLALVLVASLALKAANSAAVPDKASDWVTERMAEFLQKREFEITRNPSDVDLVSLFAVRDQCRILIANVSPLGWHRDVIRKITPDGSRLTYIFKGQLYEDQPILQTWLDHYWIRLRQSIGLSPSISPTIAVVQSAQCDVAKSPIWSELTF
jgi:hypothetical protein